MNIKEKQKYVENFDFPFCHEASKYEKLAKIRQGILGKKKTTSIQLLTFYL
jgi:cyclin-dependent kinase 9